MKLKHEQSTCGTFDSNFAFSKKFYRQMKEIVGAQSIKEAPPEDDLRKCTDLMILMVNNCRVACRVRKNSYLKYSSEITIRTRSRHHAKTEYNKLFEDAVPIDYYIYGFADKEETGLQSYVVIDWHAFMQLWNDLRTSGKLQEGKHYGNKENDDGTAFCHINISEFPESIVEVGVKLPKNTEVKYFK